MKGKLLSLSMLCIGLFVILLFAAFAITPASAQDETPPPEECQCRQCHEQQYYLYDSGKWYCLCKAPMTCVHCHSGNGHETNAELAHKDMLANPFANNAAICQDCHKGESQARVNEFVKRAGGSKPVGMQSQPAFYTADPQPFPKTEPRILGFWEWFSVALMSIVLVAIVIAWLK